jgi:large subunit ribosomal protein L21
MFAVVRTGGKQYRVAQGDKIVVEKLDGNAGDRITLGDVLLAGDGADLKSTDGLTVAAEIVAQAKADKVTVFKKRRRHNYRRKKGHRQQHTILRIVAIGDQEEDKAPAKAAKPRKAVPETAAPVVDEQPTANPAPDNPEQANPAPEDKTAPAKPKKAASGKAEKATAPEPAAETPSTENAAPAKAGEKKSSKGSKAE